MTGYRSGQSDHRISAKQGKTLVGYVDFSVYEGEPNIKYIFVSPDFRRQGIATKLMQAVQREYPDANINLGMATDMGAPFVQSLDRKFYPNAEYEQTQARLKQLKQREAELDKMQAELPDDITDEIREKMAPYWDEMNDVSDEIRQIERDSWDMKPGKWIIGTGFKEWLAYQESRT